MSVAELTNEQRTAIETRDVSIALSAGAGCGKTFVLTHRFIDHLQPNSDEEKPAQLHQMVAITFTDAAAREMRSRIRGACYEQLTHAKSFAEQEHWQRLLREIDSARVSTIHAFCASLLRTHAAAAGLDPLFGVLDQSDADVLQLEVIDDVLRAQLDKLDDDTLELAAAYGLGPLKDKISALIGRRHEDAFPRWLDATPDELVARWAEWHARDAVRYAVGEIAASRPARRLLSLLRDATKLPTTPEFNAARATLLELLPRMRGSKTTESDLLLVRESAKVDRICPKKVWASPDDYGRYQDACKKFRDYIDRHTPKKFDPEAARVTARLALSLLRLANKVVDTYTHRKQSQGKLDFDDLLFTAYSFLNDPKNDPLREQLADDLRLLLVDEFQDTDRLQTRLVRLLCGEGFDVGRLFFVGDFKQSIYRFRRAEPQVFRELRDDIKKQGQLPLTLNFRSQPGILAFVNALFCDDLQLEGEEYQALRPNREAASASPCVEFLWTLTPDKHKKGMIGAARREEARTIARRLRGLIDGKNGATPVVDRATNTPRQLKLGDVAILFRTLSDVQVYEEALREYELDYYLVGGHAFYAQQEIYDVLNLLCAVASTADEVSLAGVLRSPFFALADETLFWLVDSAGSLNAGLLADVPPPQLCSDERDKVVAAAETMRHLRAIKDRVPITTLLNQALDLTGYDAALLTEFLGQRKLANLQKLMERARAADAGVLGLDGFITQLAQFIAQQPKEALAATLPESADVIRLMTIHHAKGLEFPLVVLPDLDRRPHFGSTKAALHPEYGPLVSPPSDDDDHKDVASGMSLFASLEKAEELEERKRLLYVACTRAADYLILSSSLEAHAEPCSDWTALIGDRFDLENGALTADLAEGYATPRVHVQQDPATDHKPSARLRGPDLLKLLGEAHQLAADGHAIVPTEVGPVAVDHAARRQFSFSRLTGRLLRSEPDESTALAAATPPPISSLRTVDARTLGTLVHEVLARVDLNDAAAIDGWCEHLASQLVLWNVDEARQVARDLVERFVKSERGQKIAGAAAVHRELEFILAWPPNVQTSADTTYLHGFIDCLYQDQEGRWHLTDYKTDKIQPADVAQRAERYAMQLDVYAMAAERALGQPPSELALHFLRPGVEHVFVWDDAARKACVEMVNEAIAGVKGSGFGVQDDDEISLNLEP
jgi:ATP-dependent helicase/nuclease subunit A